MAAIYFRRRRKDGAGQYEVLGTIDTTLWKITRKHFEMVAAQAADTDTATAGATNTDTDTVTFRDTVRGQCMCVSKYFGMFVVLEVHCT